MTDRWKLCASLSSFAPHLNPRWLPVFESERAWLTPRDALTQAPDQSAGYGVWHYDMEPVIRAITLARACEHPDTWTHKTHGVTYWLERVPWPSHKSGWRILGQGLGMCVLTGGLMLGLAVDLVGEAAMWLVRQAVGALL